VDPGEPCVVGATLPDGAAPAAVPGNYPDESFYYLAVAELGVTAGGAPV
jgi:hypothetical protein